MNRSTWKGALTGFGGGLVGWWAADRFYRLARSNSRQHAILPYCVGAVAGVAYGVFVVSRKSAPNVLRVPLGAAVYLAHPEHTAVPRGGRDVPEKAGNLILRLASKGLKKAAEMALVA